MQVQFLPGVPKLNLSSKYTLMKLRILHEDDNVWKERVEEVHGYKINIWWSDWAVISDRASDRQRFYLYDKRNKLVDVFPSLEEAQEWATEFRKRMEL